MERRQEAVLFSYFGMLCLIWGLTWIPIKIGIEYLPPNFFGAVRFIAAGVLLLLFYWKRNGMVLIGADEVMRLLVVAVFMNTLTYSFLYFGISQISSGLAALLNLSTVPIFLLIFGFLMNEESVTLKKIGGIFLGVTGLGFLFLLDIEEKFDSQLLLGGSAVIMASLVYCLGSIMARPILANHSPWLLSGLVNLIGGILLLLISIVFEPLGLELLGGLATPVVFSSLAFLVIFGSVVAFSIYLKLLKEWSPVMAGMYSFVSPIIAVAVGIILLQEKFGLFDAIGMALLLGATALILFARKEAEA